MLTDETKLNFSTSSEIFGQNTRWHFLKQVFFNPNVKRNKKQTSATVFQSQWNEKEKAA